MDREKVIKGITHHKIGQCDMSGKICPYWVEDDHCSKKMLEDVLALLKEQEADIIAMSRFLESHGWDSDSICGKNVEIVVTNGDDDDA